MDQKAQGAIEYLLIIGAAILVVAIVIVAITSVVGSNKTVSTGDQVRASNTLKCTSNMTSLGGTCTVDGAGDYAATCNCCGADTTNYPVDVTNLPCQ